MRRSCNADGNKRSEDPGDEEGALEPTVPIADQQFFKMADGRRTIGAKADGK